jgi:LmbE family N-acetylglucosaminyl deacetylase
VFSVNFQKVLVLAPHTDDGELGAGGLIARLIEEGADVHYVGFSNAEESVPAGFPKDILEHELKAATAALGILAANVKLFKYPVRKFNYHRQEMLEDMIVLRKSIDPDLVLLPCRTDVHQDHEVISREGFRAFKNRTVWGYELAWNNVSLANAFYVKLEQRHIDRKCEALSHYKSQGFREYMSKDFINSLAVVRGMHISVPQAEAFELLRMIV